MVSYFLRYFSSTSTEQISPIPPDLSPVSIRLALLFLLLTRGARECAGEVSCRLQNYGLESRYSRLRVRGLLTVHEIAAHLDVSPATTKVWRRAGSLRAYRYNDKGQCLFELCGTDAPIKYQWQRNNRVKSASSAVTLSSRNL